MNAANWIALAASMLAAAVAITVPLVTFRKTLQLEHFKWTRDQRANFYIDMLTEAYAEKQWFLERMSQCEIALIEVEEQDDPAERRPRSDGFPPLPDLRMSPVDRAKFGARGQVYASSAVSKAFNELTAAMSMKTLILPKSSGETRLAMHEADRLFEALSQLIRTELGAGHDLKLPGAARQD